MSIFYFNVAHIQEPVAHFQGLVDRIRSSKYPLSIINNNNSKVNNIKISLRLGYSSDDEIYKNKMKPPITVLITFPLST